MKKIGGAYALLSFIMDMGVATYLEFSNLLVINILQLCVPLPRYATRIVFLG